MKNKMKMEKKRKEEEQRQKIKQKLKLWKVNKFIYNRVLVKKIYIYIIFYTNKNNSMLNIYL